MPTDGSSTGEGACSTWNMGREARSLSMLPCLSHGQSLFHVEHPGRGADSLCAGTSRKGRREAEAYVPRGTPCPRRPGIQRRFWKTASGVGLKGGLGDSSFHVPSRRGDQPAEGGELGNVMRVPRGTCAKTGPFCSLRLQPQGCFWIAGTTLPNGGCEAVKKAGDRARSGCVRLRRACGWTTDPRKRSGAWPGLGGGNEDPSGSGFTGPRSTGAEAV